MLSFSRVLDLPFGLGLVFPGFDLYKGYRGCSSYGPGFLAPLFIS